MRTIRSTRSARGFSVLELALAVMVVLVLLGGTILPLSTYLRSQRVDANQRSLELIRERLLEFLVSNGRLPCPADPRIAGGNAGVELTLLDGTGTKQFCAVTGTPSPRTIHTGALPWVTLRLPETDPWGHRYVYSVEASWAEVDSDCDPHLAAGALVNPPCTRPVLPAANEIVVSGRVAAGALLTPIATNLVAIVISMGPNGAGGFDTSGAQRPAPPAAADELMNALQPAGPAIMWNWNYRSRLPTPRRAPCADDTGGPGMCEFDDQMVFLTRSLALGKLLESRRLR